MDEPFSALDPIIRRDLQNQFLSLTQIMRKTTVFITHDLEEAMKLGTRVAIMRDARIVQVGTPEEIITHPANEYVTDFVRGISKQSILKVSNVMRPVKQFVLSGRSLPDFAAVACPDDRLSDLIAKVASNPGPIAVKDDGTWWGLSAFVACLLLSSPTDCPGSKLQAVHMRSQIDSGCIGLGYCGRISACLLPHRKKCATVGGRYLIETPEFLQPTATSCDNC
jgi:hypothetical protein